MFARKTTRGKRWWYECFCGKKCRTSLGWLFHKWRCSTFKWHVKRGLCDALNLEWQSMRCDGVKGHRGSHHCMGCKWKQIIPEHEKMVKIK